MDDADMVESIEVEIPSAPLSHGGTLTRAHDNAYENADSFALD